MDRSGLTQMIIAIPMAPKQETSTYKFCRPVYERPKLNDSPNSSTRVFILRFPFPRPMFVYASYRANWDPRPMGPNGPHPIFNVNAGDYKCKIHSAGGFIESVCVWLILLPLQIRNPVCEDKILRHTLNGIELRSGPCVFS